MKRILFLILALGLCAPLMAQPSGRIFRSEFLPYDTREGADKRNREAIANYRSFSPTLIADDQGVTGMGQLFDVPSSWSDSFVYLHLENVGEAYTLWINGAVVAKVEDPLTPADFEIADFLYHGPNLILVEQRASRTPTLQNAPSTEPNRSFANSYLFCQERRSIWDYEVALIPDSTRQFGVLELDIVLQNGFNYEEPVTVGYDIYDPKGKLLEYSVQEVKVAGQSRDTLRLQPYIYHTNNNRWGEKGAAPLYRLTLYTKRDGVFKEYIPLRIGFEDTHLEEGQIVRFDQPLKLTESTFNVAADVTTTRKQLQVLKKQGVNTLRPDHPQPLWFYDLCDELGLMVIERANIHAPEQRDNRRVGGTPSNDPTLTDEYLTRIEAMYRRTKNHPCVIGFALSGEAGNGYNMYKAYQWLKAVETERPVIIPDAAGEWNSDL